VDGVDSSPLPETCGAAARPVAWVRPGRVGYVGPDLGVRTHAPAVAVLTVGLDAPFVLETPDRGPVVARSAFAPARQPHRVIAPEGRILLLFLDSAPPAPGMRRQHGGCGLDHPRESELVAAGTADPEPDLDALGHLACGPSAPADPRITRLAAALHADPSRPLAADLAADRLGLSTSHFLHLFAQQTGTSFRRYRQWSRLLDVVRGLQAGHDLTRCAADAGFASPSHLSDSFRQALGTTASAVLASRVRFDLRSG
jgi:AraC-like DNA-binding protein